MDGDGSRSTEPQRGRALLLLGYSAAPAVYEESHGDLARLREALALGAPAPRGYPLD